MTSDLLTTDLQALLQLFSTLDVRFPELDGSVVKDAVTRVETRHLEVVQLEAQLQAARSALDDEHEALLKRAHRLHAYLKVFAEHDDALLAQLATISLPRLKRAPTPPKPVEVVTPEGVVTQLPAPKKRGRPRKAPVSEGLFAQTAQPEAVAVAG